MSTAVKIIDEKQAVETFVWERLTFEQLLSVRAVLIGQGKSMNTINTTLSGIRGVLRTAYHMQLVSAEHMFRINQVVDVRGHRVPKGQALSQSEVSRLLSHCKKDQSIRGKRDTAMISLMLATGLRRSEVVGLHLSDYSGQTGRLVIRIGKGSKQRIVFVHINVRKLICNWLLVRSKQAGPLFTPVNNNGALIRKLTTQRVYDIVKYHSLDAGIGHRSPHDLRRTFCCEEALLCTAD
ncbi:tyrosine-type recombinase/integrase [Pseudomonadota bacterium]